MSPIWGFFLGLCVAGVLVILARVMLAGRGAPWVEAGLGGAVPLLTGLLMGFSTLSWMFPILITWTWSAVVAGLLALHYSRQGRLAHMGLLAIGFGLTWSALLGWSVWTDLTDPGVTGSEMTFAFLGFGLAVLSAGLVITALALATRHRGTTVG